MNKYSIEQYPKYKKIRIKELNEYQITIRNNQKKYKYKEQKTCNTCFVKMSISEYYLKDSQTGRRYNKCRDCVLKSQGVLEVGKQRFSDSMFKKGFIRCSVCKETKPLNAYTKSKSRGRGISANCYECSHKLHKEFISKERATIGDHYVKEYGKRKGITKFNKKTINTLRNEIIESRKPIHFLDNKSFLTTRDLARHILDKYNIPITTTEKRIDKGVSEKDCTIKGSEYRSMRNTFGKIKVTDTVTKKVYIFKNTLDERLGKMVCKGTVQKGIKTGLPVGGYRNSLWENKLLIQRIK